MGDTGSSGPATPAGPTRPRRAAAGLDWHEYWAAERIHYWPAHDRTAVRTETAGTAGRAPMTTQAWAAALGTLLDTKRRWNDRAALAEGLTYCSDPALVPVASRLVADKQDEVRRLGVFAAASALGDDPAALGMLQAVLDDRQIDAHPRGAAAAAMGALGDPAARATLLRTLRAPHDDVIRVGAAIGVGLVGDAADVPQVMRLLEDGREDTAVRTAAVVALGLLARSPDRSTRVAATTQLLRAAERAGRLPTETRQTLALNLGHAEPAGRTVRALADLCHDDGDMRTRAMAAIGLGLLARATPDQATAAARALVQRWDREPQSVKAFLALGLGIGRCTRERARVSGWLTGGGDPLHRGAAAVALGLMGDAKSVPALLAACKRGAPRLRGDAAEGLGYIGGLEVAQQLRALLAAGKGPAALLGACAYSLGVIGRTEDLPLLEAVLDAGNPSMRMGAAYGLGAHGGGRARDLLLARTRTEPHPGVRSLAFYCSALAMAERPVLAPGKDLDRSPWAREH